MTNSETLNNVDWHYYKLDRHKNVISCPEDEWEKRRLRARRRDWIIKQSIMNDYTIITIFLGVFQRFSQKSSRYFRTTILHNNWDVMSFYASTYAQSLEKHEIACQRVIDGDFVPTRLKNAKLKQGRKK
jgi:hypothetical protein